MDCVVFGDSAFSCKQLLYNKRSPEERGLVFDVGVQKITLDAGLIGEGKCYRHHELFLWDKVLAK